MKRETLIQELSRQLDTSEHSCRVFLHAFFDVVKSLLQNGESVDLERLGSWAPVMAENSGALVDVSYTMADRHSTDDEHHVDGPASSIDALHFIPADALETNGSGSDPIDVGVIVGEVTRLFHDEQDSESADEGSAPREPVRRSDFEIPSVPEFREVLREDAAPPPTWSEDAALLRDEEELDPSQIENMPAGDTEDGPDDEVPEMIDLDEIPDPEPDEEAQSAIADEAEAHESELDDVHDISIAELPEMDSDEAIPEYAEETPEEPEGDTDDSLDDPEVFYRNRDQLYNPPKEAGNKRLWITAIVLTVCVIAIVLFLIFGGNDTDPLLKQKRDTSEAAQLFPHAPSKNMDKQSLNKSFIL